MFGIKGRRSFRLMGNPLVEVSSSVNLWPGLCKLPKQAGLVGTLNKSQEVIKLRDLGEFSSPALDDKTEDTS